MQLRARVRSEQDEELSKREAKCVYEGGRQVHLHLSVRVYSPWSSAHSAAPLNCEITVSIMNEICTSMFICATAADDGDRVGNACETE